MARTIGRRYPRFVTRSKEEFARIPTGIGGVVGTQTFTNPLKAGEVALPSEDLARLQKRRTDAKILDVLRSGKTSGTFGSPRQTIPRGSASITVGGKEERVPISTRDLLLKHGGGSPADRREYAAKIAGIEAGKEAELANANAAAKAQADAEAVINQEDIARRKETDEKIRLEKAKSGFSITEQKEKDKAILARTKLIQESTNQRLIDQGLNVNDPTFTKKADIEYAQKQKIAEDENRRDDARSIRDMRIASFNSRYKELAKTLEGIASTTDLASKNRLFLEMNEVAGKRDNILNPKKAEPAEVATETVTEGGEGTADTETVGQTAQTAQTAQRVRSIAERAAVINDLAEIVNTKEKTPGVPLTTDELNAAKDRLKNLQEIQRKARERESAA